MDVKDIIKSKRIELGYSVYDIAKIVGVNASTVSRWERGEIDNMGRDKIASLAKALHISPLTIMEWDEPPAKNIILPNAYSVPIIGKISCGAGCFTDNSYDGEFILDSSIRADYCLIASGNSMIDAGIEDGDRVFMKKTTDFHEGRIYGIVIKGEDVATLKRLYRHQDRIILQPCNSEYKPQCHLIDEVFIVGECIGVYKNL